MSNEIAGASRCWLCSTSTPLSSSAPIHSALAPPGSTTVRPGAAEEISTKTPNHTGDRPAVVVGARSLMWSGTLYVWKMWGIFSYWILLLTGQSCMIDFTDEVCQVGNEDQAHGKWRTCDCVSYPPDLRTWSVVWQYICFCLWWLDLEASLWGFSVL